MKIRVEGIDEFEIPDLWLIEAGVAEFPSGVSGFAANLDQLYKQFPIRSIAIQDIRPPKRNDCVRWFDHTRMVAILRGIATGSVLPAIAVRESRDPRDRR